MPRTYAEIPRSLSTAQLVLVEAAYPRNVVPTGGTTYVVDDDGEVVEKRVEGVTIDGSRWKTARILESIGLFEKVHGNKQTIIGFRLTDRGREDHRNRLRAQFKPAVERVAKSTAFGGTGAEVRIGVTLPRTHVALLSHLATDATTDTDAVVLQALELYATKHGRAADVNHIHRSTKIKKGS